jgi:hypothetical protein
MDRIIKYRIIIVALLFLLLSFGIFIGFEYTKNEKNEKNEDSNESVVVDNKIKEEEDSEKVKIYEEASTKTYDIEVVYKDIYSLCGHTVETSNTVYSTTLDKVKDAEIKKQNQEKKEYKIEAEEQEKIVFSRTIEGNCPNHFKVKLENGKVVIYNVVNETISTIYQTIDIPQDNIRAELLEELGIGIELNSKEELNLFIEDIEI